ncbi:MAG: type II toxin-antitoxin system death-on-curing family toxin [Mobilicoccus sp.]|nr:type II toxin-antitoxin system death-on-curing family toxin [Mobilicoccus sp.]
MTFSYLSVEDLLQIAARLDTPDARDVGLLDAAAQRPRATAFGEDAYPDLPTKAAALLSSVARNHALVDGNKRLAWSATRLFCRLNGHDLAPPSTDEAYDLVIAAATGELDAADLAPRIAAWLTPL